MLPNEPWLEPHVTTGELALDVGANIGDFTAHLLEHFNRVIAFEPHPDAARAFRVRHNGRVDFHEAAVGDHNGILELMLYPQTVHTSAVRYDDAETDSFQRMQSYGSLEAPLVTIDSLGVQPDFIKIDTEGYECQVLQGAGQTLLECKPALLVEVHFVKFAEWCEQFLEDLGYEVEKVPHPSSAAGPNNYWLVAS